MCYVGRLKGSMYLVHVRLVVRIAKKNLANMRPDLRNAANSLQIEGKGVLCGGPYHWGGRVRKRTRDNIYIYILKEYISIYVSVYIYIYLSICSSIYSQISIYNYE